MSTTTVADGGGIETWCDECGSVAYFTVPADAWWADEQDALAKGRRAAHLHEDNDCAPIWLDAEGEPTTTNTGRWAGGCDNLLEFAHSIELLDRARTT
jgi:hypothetical protein